ncbi:hypothetical protein [Listeria booriae]|uniref:Uncharacterized protein n=1 Tax=Listeria booriae TaxID=1552123 RepID=A0A841ZVR8_9LIST|nr:hypothetical protein [Listeria booriae]MBC1564152.1 hypothetical protein [Listeria booriae]MBC2103977.1 hypothetical protein [Listeria booriae]
MNINGFDDLQKNLNKLQKNAEKLQGTTEISFDDLFSNDFMKSNTDYSDIYTFLSEGGFDISNSDAFNNTDEKTLDAYVKSKTNFDSWEDMKGTAGQEYALKQLGF